MQQQRNPALKPITQHPIHPPETTEPVQGRGSPLRSGARVRLPVSLWLPCLLIATCVLIPLAYLLIRAFDAEGSALREIVFRARNLTLLANTASLTLGVLFTTTLVALPLAWLTVRTNFPLRRLLVFLGVLPLAIPGYVGAYALIAASGYGGLIEAVTGIPWPRPSGYWGALGALTLFTFPYLYLNFWAALRGLDPSLEDAARALGKTPTATFWRVTLPQLQPAFLAGGLLVALHVLGDFGVVSLMRYETFSYAIYLQYSAAFDRVYAAWLSLMLLALTGAALVTEARLLAKLRVERNARGARRQALPARLGWWLVPAALFVALIAGAALIVPLASIGYWARLGIDASALLDLREALVNSLRVSVPAALITALFALPLAYLGVRYPSPLSRVLERSAYLGYAAPPLAFALALIFFTLRTAPTLYQTLGLLIAAYVLHFLAEAVGPVRSSLYQATARLEEAARVLGLTRLSAFTRVTLPLLKPGILAAIALVLLSALKELPLTFLLSPAGFDTLAGSVWSYTAEAMFAEAAPYALILVIVSALATALILRQGREAKRPSRFPRLKREPSPTPPQEPHA